MVGTLNMTERRNSIRTKIRKQPGAFCTTCGDVLEDYCFSPDSKDVKKVIQNLAVCKAKGRFKGKFCAKLFIAGTDGSFRGSRKGRLPKRRIDNLKHAVLEEIDKEEGRKRADK